VVIRNYKLLKTTFINIYIVAITLSKPSHVPIKIFSTRYFLGLGILLSILQHSTKSIPVNGNNKKKKPNLRLPEEIELTIKNKINPRIVITPPVFSLCQDNTNPTSIISNEANNNISVLERVDGFGRPSPMDNIITSTISRILKSLAI